MAFGGARCSRGLLQGAQAPCILEIVRRTSRDARESQRSSHPMTESAGANKDLPPDAPGQARSRDDRPERAKRPKATGKAPRPEIGGPQGPEPTRYGDWERNGRCTDF